jgi:aminoglycoside 6'-N-acetyltransferase
MSSVVLDIQTAALCPYRIRPMLASDLALIRGWLAKPHVAQWWGDASEQFILVSEDLEHSTLEQYIVVTDARPFAYLQCYRQSEWPENGLGLHPAGTRGIDQFIGEPDMVGRGHGSAFIRTFVEGLLLAGTPRVLTDPAPGNARAIRAYENAGFRRCREVATPDGRALLMCRDSQGQVCPE